MTDPNVPQAYSYRLPGTTGRQAFVSIGLGALVVGLVAGIGLGIAALFGGEVAQWVTLAVCAVMVLYGMAMEIKFRWLGRVHLLDTGKEIAVTYGPGTFTVRGGVIDKGLPLFVKISGSHGFYPLRLVQGGVEVALGEEANVFPEPYLGLVAWLKGRGVLLDEQWNYPRSR